MGRRTALVTGSSGDREDVLQSRDRRPRQGQLAREVDALGGLMGTLADSSGIQFRI
jgi:tRNA U34 5-carboxymethylaminomethyl modifying enzyme MnmG/GidA